MTGVKYPKRTVTFDELLRLTFEAYMDVKEAGGQLSDTLCNQLTALFEGTEPAEPA